MRRPRYVASPDQVRVTRAPDGETAVIAYADEDIGPTYLRIGPGLDRMTDDEVLRVFNETIEAMNQSRRDYKHVANEDPVATRQQTQHQRGTRQPAADRMVGPRGPVVCARRCPALHHP